MDTAHYRVNKFVATVRVMWDAAGEPMRGDTLYAINGIKLTLADLETVIRESAAQAAYAGRILALAERARNIMHFHSQRCDVRPMHNYGGMEEHCVEYRAVVKDIDAALAENPAPLEIKSVVVPVDQSKWTDEHYRAAGMSHPHEIGAYSPDESCKLIEDALRSYVCTFTRFGDPHEEVGQALVDKLTPPYDDTIGRGEQELVLLAEHLFDALPQLYRPYREPHYKGSSPRVEQDMVDFFAGVVGAVEANGYERLKLWEEYQKEWEEDSRGGPLITVGQLAEMPVCIALNKVKVRGHSILLWEPTSQVVDHRLIKAWLLTHLPKDTRREDAMNFHNALPREPHSQRNDHG